MSGNRAITKSDSGRLKSDFSARTKFMAGSGRCGMPCHWKRRGAPCTAATGIPSVLLAVAPRIGHHPIRVDTAVLIFASQCPWTTLEGKCKVANVIKVAYCIRVAVETAAFRCRTKKRHSFPESCPQGLASVASVSKIAVPVPSLHLFRPCRDEGCAVSGTQWPRWHCLQMMPTLPVCWPSPALAIDSVHGQHSGQGTRHFPCGHGCLQKPQVVAMPPVCIQSNTLWIQ